MKVKDIISQHNENVLAYIELTGDGESSEQQKKQCGYIIGFDLLFYKKSFNKFYNKLKEVFDSAFEEDKKLYYLIMLKKGTIERIGKEINNDKNDVDDLKLKVKGKSDNYEKCIDIYKKMQSLLNDLNAKEQYEEKVMVTEQKPKTIVRLVPKYDPVLKITTTVSVPTVVHEPVQVERIIKKTRPDVKKIEKAKLGLVEIDKEIAEISDYHSNVDAYEATRAIKRIKDRLAAQKQDLESEKNAKSELISELRQKHEKTLALREILENETQLINSYAKEKIDDNYSDLDYNRF